MNNSRLISIDLAKNVFQICMMNKNKRVVENKSVRRSQLAMTMARRKPCHVVMEACYSSHYWGRIFESMGHTVSLIPAQHVKPFVRGNKNDNNDAIAIAEAFSGPILSSSRSRQLSSRIFKRYIGYDRERCDKELG